MIVTPEELLAGRSAVFDIAIPADVLRPGNGAGGETRSVRMRPLTVHDVHLIAKAAREDAVLTSVLMIQRALVEPKLKQQEIAEMHSGLIRFLVDHVNRISGLTTTDQELHEIASSPIVQAFFVLAREFHWTPEQIRGMTVAQVLGYLELLNQSKRATA